MKIYLICFLASFLALAARGVWYIARGSRISLAERILIAAIPVGFLVVSCKYLDLNALQIGDRSSSARYSTAYALSLGISPYNGPTQGLVSGWIYPPFGLIAYLPATLFRGSPDSHRIAGLLSGLYYFLPAYVLLGALSISGRGASGPSRVHLIAAFLLFCFHSVFTDFIFHTYTFTYVASFVGVDAPALGCAALACAFLLRHQDSHGAVTLWASGIFAALALWSKQLCFPLYAILPAWVLMTQGLRAAVTYVLVLLCSLAAVSAVFFSVFGFQDMMFNMARLPTKHPLVGQFPKNVIGMALEFFKYMFALFVVPGAALIYEFGSGRRDRTWSEWLAENRWMLAVFVGLTLFPTGLLARLKAGGDLNAYAYCGYFLLIACCALSTKLMDARDGAVAGSFVVSVVASMILWASFIGTQDIASRLNRPPTPDGPPVVAYRYLKAHPTGAYFPTYPLAHLLADGKQYHVDFGIYDREIGGFQVSQAQFDSGIPANTELICFAPGNMYISSKLVVNRLMSAYEPVASIIPGLPDWHCYRKRK